MSTWDLAHDTQKHTLIVNVTGIILSVAKQYDILTLFISFILVNWRPNSHKSTPNFSAQFRTLQFEINM